MAARNLTKPFCIGGFILGEIYGILAAVAPYYNGVAVSADGKFARVVYGAIFFGPFGAAFGMGIGLLVGALWRKRD